VIADSQNTEQIPAFLAQVFAFADHVVALWKPRKQPKRRDSPSEAGKKPVARHLLPEKK
jgi:hypothetical protein